LAKPFGSLGHLIDCVLDLLTGQDFVDETIHLLVADIQPTEFIERQLVLRAETKDLPVN
jgi:hypothetical protein